MEVAMGLTAFELAQRWREIDLAAPGTKFVGLSFAEMPSWNDICVSLNWEFYLPDDGHFTKRDHGYFGVYRLIALTSERDLAKPASLNRVAGPDASGTLYIGETGNLARRLNELQRSGWGSRNEDSHGAIAMLRQIKCLSFFPNRIGIALLLTDVGDTRGIERDLMRSYMNSFGDTPPLNYRR